MYSITFRVTVFACVFFAAVSTAATHAQVVVQVDGSDPFIPVLDAIGGVFSNGTDLDIDFSTPTGGGIVEFPLSSQGVFDVTMAQVSIDFTIGDNNTVPTLDVLLFDFDDPQSVLPDDLHVYVFPLAGLATNVLHNITSPLIVPGAPNVIGTQPLVSIPIGPAGDSILNFDANGGLDQVGLGFVGPGLALNERVQITVHDVRILAVPEPGCLTLLGMGTALMLGRRRR